MRLVLLAILLSHVHSYMIAGDVFVGSYTCGTAAWLFMHIEQVSAEAVSAVFHFVYPTSTQHGAYVLQGRFVRPGVLKFEPGAWLHTATGKIVPVGLTGMMSMDGSTFSGEVLHNSCGSFHVTRTEVDIDPPATTVELGTLTAEGAQPSVMKLSTVGGLVGHDPSSASLSRQRLQMILNGVGGLVEEARTVRRARQTASDEAAARSAAEASTAAATTGARWGGETSGTPSSGEPVPRVGELSADERAQLQLLEVQLQGAIDERLFLDAYKLWRAVPSERVQLAAAQALVGRLVARQTSLAARLPLKSTQVHSSPLKSAEAAAARRASTSAGDAAAAAAASQPSGEEADALRALAVFGSRMPAAARALVAILAAADDGAGQRLTQRANLPYTQCPVL